MELAELESQSISTVEEITTSREDLIELCKSDPDALAAMAMPEVFEYCWPTVFVSIWHWLLETVHKKRDFSKLAIGLPRGFGKTTIVKLFILYCILFTDRKFILILSATKDLAINIISDIMDMLSEPNIKSLFGDWSVGVEVDQKHLKKFRFRGRDIIIAGIGAEGSVRGLNLKNARPDVMVFEDTQSREDADSQIVSEKIYKWMLGTAMKAKSPKGCMSLFIANMYPTPHSILKKLLSQKSWIKYVAGGILVGKDGQLSSLWEELQPLEQLLTEYESDRDAGHPEIFNSEVLNDPNANVNNKINVDKIPYYPYDLDDLHTGNFIIIDPATDRANADDISIGYFEVHDARPALLELDCGVMSPGKTIWNTLEMAQRRNCTLIIVEGNAYQSTLCYWFEVIMTQIGVEGIQVLPIFSGKNSKNSRILNMFKQLVPDKDREGSIPDLLIGDDVRSQVISQISGFVPLRSDNIDGILDLLTYAPRVLGEMSEYLKNQTLLEEQSSSGLDMAVITGTSPF